MSIATDQERLQSNFKRAKVLVIEDSDDHWFLIQSAMRECLPEVSAVRVAAPLDALVLLRDWSTQEWEIPKLIFQDLYVPERQDGWNLLRQIKAMPVPCNQVPVIVFSSSDIRDDITEAYQYGCASYLVKPTGYEGWITYFQELRAYWWETVTLPPMQFSV